MSAVCGGAAAVAPGAAELVAVLDVTAAASGEALTLVARHGRSRCRVACMLDAGLHANALMLGRGVCLSSVRGGRRAIPGNQPVRARLNLFAHPQMYIYSGLAEAFSLPQGTCHVHLASRHLKRPLFHAWNRSPCSPCNHASVRSCSDLFIMACSSFSTSLRCEDSCPYGYPLQKEITTRYCLLLSGCPTSAVHDGLPDAPRLRTAPGFYGHGTARRSWNPISHCLFIPIKLAHLHASARRHGDHALRKPIIQHLQQPGEAICIRQRPGRAAYWL